MVATCKFVDGRKHARSLDPWCETHDRSASVCLAAAVAAVRKPGRPKRADNLDPNSREARRKRGKGIQTVTISDTVAVALDTIASALSLSRSATVAALVKAWKGKRTP